MIFERLSFGSCHFGSQQEPLPKTVDEEPEKKKPAAKQKSAAGKSKSKEPEQDDGNLEVVKKNLQRPRQSRKPKNQHQAQARMLAPKRPTLQRRIRLGQPMRKLPSTMIRLRFRRDPLASGLLLQLSHMSPLRKARWEEFDCRTFDMAMPLICFLSSGKNAAKAKSKPSKRAKGHCAAVEGIAW